MPARTKRHPGTMTTAFACAAGLAALSPLAAHAQGAPALLTPSPAPAYGGATAPANAPAATTAAPPLPGQGQQAAVIPTESTRAGLPSFVGKGPLTGGGHYLLRFNEDWCNVRPSATADLAERLALKTKCIPLGNLADSYVTFSGLERLKPAYQKRSNLVSAGPQDETQVFIRSQYGADVHISPYFRAFAEVVSGTQGGWNLPAPNSRQRDSIELGELFAEPMLPLPGGGKIGVRVGREKYFFGNGLIVSDQPVPNIERSFNGAHAYYQSTYVRVDLFAAHATSYYFGDFNDKSDDNNRLSGAYASVALPRLPGVSINVDPFAINFRQANANYDGLRGNDSRHTLGARFWGEAGPVDLDWTVAHQLGNLGPANVSANAAFTNTAYVFRGIYNKPQLGGRFDYMSGGKSGNNVHTWNPIYLRPEYFTSPGYFAGSNLVDFGPTAAIDFPTQKVRLDFTYLFFYRESATDAIYGANFVALRNSTGRTAIGPNFIAQQAAVNFRWDATANLQFSGTLAYITPSHLLRRIGGRDLPNGTVVLAAQF